MTGTSYDKDEEEVLSGVSMLQQELEFERSLNDGLSKKYEEMRIQQDNDNELTTDLRKRIVQLEHELCKGLSQSNAKRSGDEAIVTKLRTMLEKSEASRQQSEYNLLLEQKKCRDLVVEMSAREKNFKLDIQKYSDSLKEYSKRTHDWEKAIVLAEKAAVMEKENFQLSLNKLQLLISEKDGVIELLNSEALEKNEKLRELSESLESEKKGNERTHDVLKSYEDTISQQKEALKQAGLKQAVYEQKDKKFRKEIKELIKERNNMEGMLQRERGLNIQNTQQLSGMTEKVIQLEEANKDLKNCLQNEIELRNKAESDCETRREEIDGLKSEMSGLRDMVSSLTATTKLSEEESSKLLVDKDKQILHLQSEIQKHQSICSDMTQDLATLQQSMSEIELQYGKSISSLERLYYQYASEEGVSPTEMVKSLAIKLREYNGEILRLDTENTSLTRAMERMESVSGIQKKSIESKSDTIQTLQNQVKELSEQNSSLEDDVKLYHTNSSALQQQLQDMTCLLATEQEKALTLLKDKKEFIKQKHVLLKEQCDTVRGLCDILGDKTLTDKSDDWSEVCQVAFTAARKCVAEKRDLLNLVKEAQDDATSCHNAMENLSKDVDSVRLECSKKLTENENAHSQHSEALQSNYMQLIETLNTKLKVSELNVKKTNENIRGLYDENEGLKETVSSLEQDLLTSENRRLCFQAAVGMLGSQVLHHMNSYNRLLHVLAIQKRQNKQTQQKMDELQCLSEALNETKPDISPIFKFRNAAIAVLAANRFRSLGREFKRSYMLGVPHGANPIEWLESEDLDKLISKPIRNWRSKPLSDTTDRLVSVIYNNTDTLCAEVYGDSLLYSIARGQRKLQTTYSLPNPVSSVRTFVLSLTERLHSVETERRSLITKVNHWQKEAKELKGAVEQTEILNRKVTELENMAFETVPITKHESVMKELASVMTREESLREEAHNLRQRLKHLETSYENTATQLKERTETLDEAVKDLADHKLQHRQQEIDSRATARKLATLEGEKRNFHEQVTALQRSSDSMSRDRDVLLRFLSKVQVALQERKISVTSGNSASSTGYISSENSKMHQIEEVQKICALYEDIIKLTDRRVGISTSDKLQSAGSCPRLPLEDIPTGKPLVSMDGKKEDTMVPLLHIPVSDMEQSGYKQADVMSWS